MTGSRLSVFAAAAFGAVLLIAGTPAQAEEAQVFTITIKDHKFEGDRLVAIREHADATAEEFESSTLKVEKIIPGGQQGTVRLRPLAVGSYAFIGEFHSDTANGSVIAE